MLLVPLDLFRLAQVKGHEQGMWHYIAMAPLQRRQAFFQRAHRAGSSFGNFAIRSSSRRPIGDAASRRSKSGSSGASSRSMRSSISSSVTFASPVPSSLATRRRKLNLFTGVALPFVPARQSAPPTQPFRSRDAALPTAHRWTDLPPVKLYRRSPRQRRRRARPPDRLN